MSKARELSQRAGVDGALSNRNLLINNDFRIWQLLRVGWNTYLSYFRHKLQNISNKYKRRH